MLQWAHIYNEFAIHMPKQQQEVFGIKNGSDVDSLMRQGVVVDVPRSDILPAYRELPELKEKSIDGVELPLRVAVAKSPQGKEPSAAVMQDSKGKPYVLISEDAHRWSDDYVKQYMAPKDASFATMATVDDFKNVNHDYHGRKKAIHQHIDRNLDALAATTQNIAGNMGVGPVDVRIGSLDNTIAAATTSKEDTHYVLLDKHTFRNVLAADAVPDVANSVIGHEVSHTTTRANLVIRHNGDITAQQAFEIRADELGTGPLGSGKPEELAKLFRQDLRSAIPIYNKALDTHIDPDTQDRKALNAVSKMISQRDPEHPPLLYRAERLELQATLMKQYEAEHGTPKSVEDRRAEANWLGNQLNSSASKDKLASTLNIEQMVAIEGMMPLAMKEMPVDGKPKAAITPAASSFSPAVQQK